MRPAYPAESGWNTGSTDGSRYERTTTWAIRSATVGTIDFGIANGLSSGFVMFNFASSQDHAAPVDRIDIPGEPAPSLHPHPSEQELHHYYEPVRQRAPQPVLSASGFRRWHAPSRRPSN